MWRGLVRQVRDRRQIGYGLGGEARQSRLKQVVAHHFRAVVPFSLRSKNRMEFPRRRSAGHRQVRPAQRSPFCTRRRLPALAATTCKYLKRGEAGPAFLAASAGRLLVLTMGGEAAARQLRQDFDSSGRSNPRSSLGDGDLSGPGWVITDASCSPEVLSRFLPSITVRSSSITCTLGSVGSGFFVDPPEIGAFLPDCGSVTWMAVSG